MDGKVWCLLVVGLVLLTLAPQSEATVSCYICGACNDDFKSSEAQQVSGCSSCKKHKLWGDYSSTVVRTCELQTIGDGCTEGIYGVDEEICYCRSDLCNSTPSRHSATTWSVVMVTLATFMYTKF